MRKDGLDINNGKSWIERLNANNISFCCSLRNKEEKAPISGGSIHDVCIGLRENHGSREMSKKGRETGGK